MLGDIVHSRPYYDGHDPSNRRVYVGANDGMLHAFDAATGAEVFAYIPSMLIPRLKSLAQDTDPVVHNYFVDGSPNARKVNFGGGDKYILVGGLGAGGSRTDTNTDAIPGLYALDITDATAGSEAAAAAKILGDHARQAGEARERHEQLERLQEPRPGLRRAVDRPGQYGRVGGDHRQRLQQR